MKVGICTLGCKVNTYESEFFIQELEKNGYSVSSFDDICDVYIINTCTVTNTSDIKSRKMIHRARRKNKDAVIVAVGCFIEANPDFFDPDIDIYLGNGKKSLLINLLDEYLVQRKPLRLINQEKEKFDDMFLTNFKGRVRAFVKIQDGCEQFCSYCIIPYVRGKTLSKDLETTLKEIKTLLEKGYQEIVLTGIHTGRYGLDLNTNFAHLLQEIVKLKGLARLRISSIEVTELTDEVIEVIKNNNVIVDHLHIPLQAGSAHILKEMNRPYDLKYFKDKIKTLRSIRKDIAITTDVIVGFPKESDLDFEETLKTVEELAFAKIHVFPYSKRKGTKAALLEGQIDSSKKKARALQLIKKSKELEQKYANKFINHVVSVLIETTKENISMGHTSNYLLVKINKKLTPNTFVSVKILGYDGFSCFGEEVREVVCQK